MVQSSGEVDLAAGWLHFFVLLPARASRSTTGQGLYDKALCPPSADPLLTLYPPCVPPLWAMSIYLLFLLCPPPLLTEWGGEIDIHGLTWHAFTLPSTLANPNPSS